jgi:large subunit ribosomal protein L27
MAHTKSGGSTKLGRESASQRLGIKMNHGQSIKAGQIIVRQRGTKYLSGNNTALGVDDTIYSKIDGVINFKSVKKSLFDGSSRYAKKISVLPTQTDLLIKVKS